MYRREGNKLHMCIVYDRTCMLDVGTSYYLFSFPFLILLVLVTYIKKHLI